MSVPQKGFTLAELLIAIALLGIIAAFTIPKVIQSAQSQETTAKLLDAVADLEATYYGKFAAGDLIYGAKNGNNNQLYDQIEGSLNTVYKGSGNVTDPDAPLSDYTNAPGLNYHLCADLSSDGYVQFPNSVLITGLDGNAGTPFSGFSGDLWSTYNGADNYVLCIDTNGAGSPNKPGQDIFIGNFNLYSAFNGTGAATAKSFNWGSADPVDGIVYARAAAPAAASGAAPFANVGNPGAYTPIATVGSKLVKKNS